MKYALSFLLLLLIQQPVQAQSSTSQLEREIGITRTLINDKRNSLLAFNMSFTESEKEAFWPLYREYRNAMTNVETRQMSVIIDYAEHADNMTQEKARDLLNRHFIYAEQSLKIKQLYTRKFRVILPDIKVTRLMQLENRMDAAVSLKYAEGIPLME